MFTVDFGTENDNITISVGFFSTVKKNMQQNPNHRQNKTGYMATPVTCGWAAAALEKVKRAFGQEQ